MKYGPTNLPEVILKKIDFSGPCWEWMGSVDPDGYGKIWWEKSSALAHRVVFKILVRNPEKGLVLDHLCENKICVNPSHLNETTIWENCFRSGRSVGCVNLKKTHCPQGHELSREKSRNRRFCHACKKKQNLASYYRCKAPKDVPFGGK